MPASILFDIGHIDFDQPAFDLSEVEKINPHRDLFRMLDNVAWVSDDNLRTATAKDIGHDEFWVAGHVPGRPLFPGVLQIETAAQLASFVTLRANPQVPFMGFVAADDFKFRGQVVPGDRLIILAEQISFRRQRSVCQTQGWVNGKMAFEGKVTGMFF